MLIIFGSESEFNLIRPYLVIKHQCPSIFSEFEKCKFTTKIDLPYNDPKADSERNIIVPISGASTEVHCE
ncbi:hypothetical protein Ddc_02874 [Ditylenchus destructor]|nr:hypothetical protein Ddc_02874 [Ditylenchus destructor]